MDTVATVLDVEPDGSIKYDLGGGDVGTAEHFTDSGVDAPPLSGDYVALSDGPGTGERQVTGYDDGTEQKSLTGEHRTYSRSEGGVVVAEIWLRRDGSIEVTSVGGAMVTVRPDGSMKLQGNMEIEGDLQVTGEVTAKSASGPVKLSTHVHPTGMGPSGQPTVGS